MNKQVLALSTWHNLAFVLFTRHILSTIIKKTFLIANNPVIKTTAKNLQAVLLFFKMHSLCNYKQLVELAVEDTPKWKHRFRANYILSTFLYAHKILVSITTNELLYLPSVTRIFSSAGWLEREVWDLFGIYFYDNNDLRRILTDYGFSGHPLRKDFPLSGFSEVYYSLEKKRLLSGPVELAQEYRVFTI